MLLLFVQTMCRRVLLSSRGKSAGLSLQTSAFSSTKVSFVRVFVDVGTFYCVIFSTKFMTEILSHILFLDIFSAMVIIRYCCDHIVNDSLDNNICKSCDLTDSKCFCVELFTIKSAKRERNWKRIFMPACQI